MDQQQEAFLLQVSRQLETVLAACTQNGAAEVLVGSKRHSNKIIRVKLVAEETTLTPPEDASHKKSAPAG